MNAIVPVSQPKNPAISYLHALSKPSRRVMRTALENVARLGGVSWQELAWETLLPEHTQFIRTELAEKYHYATANRHLSALRGVLRECWRQGLMDSDTYHRCIDIKPIAGSDLPAGRDLDDTEIRELLLDAMSEKKVIGTRDAAIIGILYMTGLRRAELVRLDMEDYQDGRFIINGKGNKQRIVHVKNKGAKLLERWISERGVLPGPLFCPMDKHGNISIEPITTQGIYIMLKRRGKRLGIVDFSPHDFRRTFVGNLLDAGVDIATVSKMAGHSDIRTTQRYDRRPDRIREEAAAKLDLPI
jgi:site-specific recombinase XerD